MIRQTVNDIIKQRERKHRTLWVWQFLSTHMDKEIYGFGNDEMVTTIRNFTEQTLRGLKDPKSLRLPEIEKHSIWTSKY